MTRRQLWTLFWSWGFALAIAAAVLCLVSDAFGQCSGPSCSTGNCPTPGGTVWQQPQWAAPQANQPALRPNAAMMRVECWNADGTVGMASGFVVAANTQDAVVLTCAHALEDSGTIFCVAADGAKKYQVVVDEIDRPNDVAALRIRNPGVTPLPIASEEPQIGETLHIAGWADRTFARASGKAVSFGTIGQSPGVFAFELTCIARSGQSGGPIYNSRGAVVGVIAAANEGSTVGACLPRLRGFVDRLFVRLRGKAVNSTPTIGPQSKPAAAGATPAPAVAPLSAPSVTPPQPTQGNDVARPTSQDANRSGPSGSEARPADRDAGGSGPTLAPFAEDLLDLRRQVADLRARLEAAKDSPPPPDYARIAQEVHKRLPPLYVKKTNKATGKEEVTQVHLGEGLDFVLVPHP
jgi:hypothetical protein